VDFLLKIRLRRHH